LETGREESHVDGPCSGWGADRVRTNLQRFQEDVRQRLRVLETTVTEARRERSPEAEDSVRRVARSIGHSAAEFGLEEIRRRAEAVASAETRRQLFARTRSLLRIVSSGTPSEGTEVARILVIEDDPVTARVVQSIVEAEGRELVVVDSAAEANRLLESRSIDLLLLDLLLPDADGRDFLVALRHRPGTADVPVVVCSSLPALRAEPECLALGAQAYLEKPLQPELTRSTVSRILEEEGDPGEGLAEWPSWVVDLAALSEAYEAPDDNGERSQHPASLASIEINGDAKTVRPRIEAVRAEALREVLSRVGGGAGPSPVVAGDPAGRLYALFPGVAVGAAVETLRDAPREAPVPGDDSGLRAGVVDVSNRPPLREAMARADRLLYRAQSQGPPGAVVSEQEHSPPSHKILFVEDDRVTARLVLHRLGKEGFEVLHYDHGGAAFEAAEKERVTLAIFDVKLPGMNGFELLERVRAMPHFAEVPVIMLTSMGREPDVVRGFELGADDYVLKPFSPVELLARIHRLLEGRHHAGGS
jgi:DNA-binding response OmpR family regulator